MYLVVLYCVALCCSDFERWVWYAYCCWVVVCVVLLCGFGLLRWFGGLLFLFLDFVVCCDIDSPDSGWVSWFWGGCALRLVFATVSGWVTYAYWCTVGLVFVGILVLVIV